MNRTFLAALAAVVATTTFTPVAHAAPSPNDSGCGFVGSTDPSPEAPEGVVTVVLFGGPITQNGTLTCTIQAGASTHGATTLHRWSLSATASNGVAFLPPTPVSFVPPPAADLYLCDRFFDGATTWVWDAATSRWVDLATNPGATCLRAAHLVDDVVIPIVQPVFDVIEQLNDVWDPISIDPVICPILATLQGDYVVASINAQGDVFLLGDPFWDCPPYDFPPASGGRRAEVYVAYHLPESLS